jgi:hypothetical protein
MQHTPVRATRQGSILHRNNAEKGIVNGLSLPSLKTEDVSRQRPLHWPWANGRVRAVRIATDHRHRERSLFKEENQSRPPRSNFTINFLFTD